MAESLWRIYMRSKLEIWSGKACMRITLIVWTMTSKSENWQKMWALIQTNVARACTQVVFLKFYHDKSTVTARDCLMSSKLSSKPDKEFLINMETLKTRKCSQTVSASEFFGDESLSEYFHRCPNIFNPTVISLSQEVRVIFCRGMKSRQLRKYQRQPPDQESWFRRQLIISDQSESDLKKISTTFGQISVILGPKYVRYFGPNV